jgi:antitoxin ParD1/3/4
MAISVELGSSLETIVGELVSTGRYNSKSEVLREGVRLVQERERKLAVVEAALSKGMAEADASEFLAADAVFDRLEAKYMGQAKTR